MSWFDNIKNPKIKGKQNEGDSTPSTPENPQAQSQGEAASTTRVPARIPARIPDGFWVKCSSCGEILQSKALKENLQVCTECEFHFRVSSRDRVYQIFGSAFEEWDAELSSSDPLKFTDTKSYVDRIRSAKANTDVEDAIVTGLGQLTRADGSVQEVAFGAFEFRFMGGSMGSIVGEKIARLFEQAVERKIPAVIVSSSGGARMQEGILSLMQMAKTTAMVGVMNREKLPYLSILADPTTGGVAASFAMLGDLIIAEPGALIGFAGPRIVEQTMRQALPPGFQRSEFLLKHGFLDLIVKRKDLPSLIERSLRLLTPAKRK